MVSNIKLLATAAMLACSFATNAAAAVPDTWHQESVRGDATVTAMNDDIAKCLDLQAVGAAFAQCATVQEFENLLNDSSEMLSNLDLNQDGYIDYLRVLETIQDDTHVFVIQAVLGTDVFQDVATIVARVARDDSSCRVQIIGSPYIYGRDYIIEPVFVARPVIFAHLLVPHYVPWISPWHWGHYPACYRCLAPRYVHNYCAHISHFIHSHRYCRSFRSATVCHYPSYWKLSRSVGRNDYWHSHPERSFSAREARRAGGPDSRRYGRAASTAGRGSHTGTATSRSSAAPSGYRSNSASARSSAAPSGYRSNSASARSSAAPSGYRSNSASSRSSVAPSGYRSNSASARSSAAPSRYRSNSGPARSSAAPSGYRSNSASSRSNAAPSRYRSNSAPARSSAAPSGYRSNSASARSSAAPSGYRSNSGPSRTTYGSSNSRPSGSSASRPSASRYSGSAVSRSSGSSVSRSSGSSASRYSGGHASRR